MHPAVPWLLNCREFLRSSENKTELFRYLSIKLSEVSDGKILCAYDDTITAGFENSMIAPTDHEEADTRLFLHVKDAVQNGFENVMIRTVDTDVLILSITLYNSLSAQTLWVDFGMGKNRCYIPVHDIVLDPMRRKGLRFFYSLTGCDQVSFFSNVTKNTAWKIWQVFIDVNETFATLSDEPTEDSLRNALPLIERFVILL